MPLLPPNVLINFFNVFKGFFFYLFEAERLLENYLFLLQKFCLPFFWIYDYFFSSKKYY